MKIIVKIKKDFGSFVLDVNFTSEVKNLSLLGRSGSGKSLTLKCIAGIIKPDEGYIELNGRVLFDSANGINLHPQERRVGYLFQNYALFPTMSVKKNILVGLHQEKDKIKRDNLLNGYLKKFQLEKIADNYPYQISGGESQRVALARCLASNPEIILLDEPFSALDVHLRNRLQMEMKAILGEYNGQCILVSHDRDEAYLLSKEIVLMDNGHNVIQKDTKELFKVPEYYEAAIITGCKNFSKVVLDNDNLLIEDWGISIPKDNSTNEYRYVGIRAHRFKLNKADYNFPIRIVDVTEEPFEQLVRFRFINQKEESEDIFFKISKSVVIDSSLDLIGIDKDDILLLK